MAFFRKIFSKKPRIKKTEITRRFDLIARVGQGSMSKVWRARDTKTGQTVALKVLDKEKTERLESRFVGMTRPPEGEIAISLKHPHIVTTFEHGITTQNEQFLVMEFVEGLPLSYYVDVQNKAMRENRLDFIIQLGEAISHFHKENWIHRDICPRNVLISEEMQVKLIDFGLVVPFTTEFCRPGNRTGTANYMAPELIKRQKTDQRLDIFSFAVTCYEMYTKKYPWDTAATLETVLQHINSPPTDIRTYLPDIDDQVADSIMRGLERYPADRWATIDAMLKPMLEAKRRNAK